MDSSKERRALGMNRAIPRRDFLNGVAIGITGAYAALNGLAADAGEQTPPTVNAEDYPPLRSGLRGQYPGAVAEFERIRQGKYAEFPVSDNEIHEEYDLVVVGGGISGLSAAYFYRTALGPAHKILILDNHDDFGGHAKRNEFHYKGREFFGFGGTMGIATPFPYSYTAKALIKDLGVQVERGPEFHNREIEEKYSLGAGVFFNKEHFGEDRLVAGLGRLSWKSFFEKAPLSEAARIDLTRLHGKNPDYMPGLRDEEKRAKLAKMSYQDFLLNVAKMSPDALPFFPGGRRTEQQKSGHHARVGGSAPRSNWF